MSETTQNPPYAAKLAIIYAALHAEGMTTDMMWAVICTLVNDVKKEDMPPDVRECITRLAINGLMELASEGTRQ